MSRLSRNIVQHYQTRVYDEALKFVAPSTLYSDCLVCSVCNGMYTTIDKCRQNMIWASFSSKIKEKVRGGHAFASDDVLRQAIRLSSANSTKKTQYAILGIGDMTASNRKLIPSKPKEAFVEDGFAKENRPEPTRFHPYSDPYKLLSLGIDDSTLTLRAKKLLQRTRGLRTLDGGSPIDPSDPCLTMAFIMQGSKAFS